METEQEQNRLAVIVGAQNFLFAVQEWYKTQNDEDTLQIALQVLHEVQNQENQA